VAYVHLSAVILESKALESTDLICPRSCAIYNIWLESFTASFSSVTFETFNLASSVFELADDFLSKTNEVSTEAENPLMLFA